MYGITIFKALKHLISVSFFSSCNADNNVCTFYDKIVTDKL